MKKLNIFLGLILVLATMNATAQCINTSTLNVSTGYDPNTGTYITPPGLDPMWRLISAPASTSGQTLNVNGPSHVIPMHSAWAYADTPGNNARYISPYNTSWSQFEYDNYPSGTPVIFEREFCICTNNSVENVSFDLKLNADNWGQIDLIESNGTVHNLITQTMPSSPPMSNFNDAFPDTYTGIIALGTGTHIIRATLRNNGSVSGLSLYGSLTSNALMSDNLCNDSGLVAGYKFSDVNGNGVFDAGTDQSLANWTINIRNSMGVIVGTAQTDATGYYSFNVASGTYTVEEVNQTGWTMVNPSNGIHNVNVVANGAYQLDFLNAMNIISDPCDEQIDFEFVIRNCAVQFDMSAISIPSPFNIVSIEWDFGDGSTSSEMNPLHYYDNPGVYVVCLKIKIFDGEKCCDLEVCKEIEIREKCPEGCEIMANPFFEIERCQVSFFANPDLSGAQITSFFWSFGDGNTSTQMNPVHSYNQSGIYNVSLFIFGVSADGKECCFREIRMEIQVECELGKRSLMQGETEPTTPARLYPNPSDDEFNLVFEAKEEISMEYQIYDLQGRVLEQRTFDDVSTGMQEIKVGRELPTGVYILQIRLGNERDALQLIKQ